MITELIRARLRLDLGDTGNTQIFPDVETDDAYARAEAKYTSVDPAIYSEVLYQTARLILIGQLRASTVRMVTYQQNQSTENLSDVQKHLKGLQDDWKNDLKDELKNVSSLSGGGVRYGGMRGGKPHRVKDIPSVY